MSYIYNIFLKFLLSFLTPLKSAWQKCLFVCFCFYIKQDLFLCTEILQTFLQLQTFGTLVHLGHGAAAYLSYLEIKCISCPLWVVLICSQDRHLEILKAWLVAHCYIRCCKGVNIFQENPRLCYLLFPIYVQGLWLKWA